MSILARIAWLLTGTLAAQSPLTTTYAWNGGGAAGGQVLFDLAVNTTVTITRLDVNSSSPAGTAGTIEVYTTPSTYVGNENNAAAWSLAGSGPVQAEGSGMPSPVCFSAGIVLTPGSHGVAVRYLRVDFLRTNGNGSNQVYSNAELTLTAGATQTVPWGIAFQPRVWNGSIHYLLGTAAGPFVCATADVYGSGCGGLSLAAIGAPRLGSAVILRAAGIPAGPVLTANVVSFTQHDPGIDLTSSGAPGCFQFVGLDAAVYGTGAPIFDRSLAVPNSATLLGIDAFSQAATFVPGSNPLGVITSNGVQLRVGNA